MTEQTAAAGQTISFEFFPPNTPKGADRLWRSVERLAPLAPEFVSVTYGAGGTTRERTLEAIRKIREIAHLDVAGHLTCVGASRAETLDVARGYATLGARSVVALRGDPPQGETQFTPHPDGFRSAAELVTALAADGVKNIYVAAYPETHPEAISPEADIDNLKRKLDAGATAAITQFFFDTDLFERFLEKTAAAGITAPIYPGILPVENFTRMVNFAARCDASVPQWMHEKFEGVEDPADRFALAVDTATEACEKLTRAGAAHIHFYTLNNPDLCFEICKRLGAKEKPLADPTRS